MDTDTQCLLRRRVAEGERIELARVSMGIRRPPEWVTRRLTAGIRYQGQLCRGCEERIIVGEQIIIETDLNCAIEKRRYRFWHRGHDPASVQRALNRLRRQVLVA